MEKRAVNVIISSAGGTAAKGSKTYKVPLPSSWMKTLRITDEDRELEISFDGTKVILSRRTGIDEFAKQRLALGHDVRLFRYFDADTLCTTICADFTAKDLVSEIHTDNPVKSAFGDNALPVWTDFEAFLEERCIPRERAGLREYLDAMELSEYDPYEIICKTGGRMAEDNQWIEVEVLDNDSAVSL